jgi:hypothetical protein
MELLTSFTPTCCRSDDPALSLEFHCQEVKVDRVTTHLVLACLPPTTCAPGKFDLGLVDPSYLDETAFKDALPPSICFIIDAGDRLRLVSDCLVFIGS